MLGDLLLFRVAKERSDGSTCTGQDANDRAEDGAAGDDTLQGPHFFQGRHFGRHIRLAVLAGDSLQLGRLVGLLEDFGDGEEADHDGDHFNAGGEETGAEGQAGHAQQGVQADTGQQQTQQAGDDGAADIAFFQACQDGQAHEGDGKQFRGAKAQGSLGQLRAEDQHTHGCEHAADGRGDELYTQSFAGFAALCHGVTVISSRGGGRDAGDLEQDGCHAAAGDGCAVNCNKECDGADSVHLIGEGDAEGDSHGGRNAGQSTEQRAKEDREDDKDEHLRGKNDRQAAG